MFERLHNTRQVCKVCQVDEETLTVGVQQARDQLRTLIDNTLEQHDHIVITRNGRPVAALVPYTWYTMTKNDSTTGDDQ